MHVCLPNFLDRRSHWSARGGGVTSEITAQVFKKCNIHRYKHTHTHTAYFSYVTSSHSAEEEEVAWLLAAAAVQRELLQGWDGKGKDAEGGRWKVLSRSLPPASLFQASVHQQLSEERQIKVRGDRQGKETCCHKRAPV